jgi:hypothetical protein
MDSALQHFSSKYEIISAIMAELVPGFGIMKLLYYNRAIFVGKNESNSTSSLGEPHFNHLGFPFPGQLIIDQLIKTQPLQY